MRTSSTWPNGKGARATTMIGETVYSGSLGHQKLGRNVPATSRGQAADVPDGNVITRVLRRALQRGNKREEQHLVNLRVLAPRLTRFKLLNAADSDSTPSPSAV